MSSSFRDDCREKGGRIKETADGLVCRITGDNSSPYDSSTDHVNPGENNESNRSQTDIYTSGNTNWMTERVLNALPSFVNVETEFIALVVLLGGLAFSGFMKAYGMGYLLDSTGFGANFVPSLISTFVPIVPFFLYHGLPNWFWYSVSFSWLGDVLAIMLVWGILDEDSGISLVLGTGFGTFVIANTIVSTVLAYGISLTTVAGNTASNFWQLFLVTRLGILGLLLPATTGTLFQFSQITWAVVVLLLFLKYGTISFL